MEEMKYKLPVKAYMFGTTWEIRDRQNRKVFQFTPLSGDIQYKALMVKRTEWVAKLINENAIDIPDVVQTTSEVEQTQSVVEQTINEVIANVDEPVIEQPKKQRGRPKKNG